MKKHTKVYMKYFNFGKEDFIPCEICAKKAVDIHHIQSRGMGGTIDKDVIENLMAVCRECHIKYGDIADKREWLIELHHNFMKRRKN